MSDENVLPTLAELGEIVERLKGEIHPTTIYIVGETTDGWRSWFEERDTRYGKGLRLGDIPVYELKEPAVGRWECWKRGLPECCCEEGIWILMSDGSVRNTLAEKK